MTSLQYDCSWTKCIVEHSINERLNFRTATSQLGIAQSAASNHQAICYLLACHSQVLVAKVINYGSHVSIPNAISESLKQTTWQRRLDLIGKYPIISFCPCPLWNGFDQHRCRLYEFFSVHLWIRRVLLSRNVRVPKLESLAGIAEKSFQP